jgi:hypothetical protein
LVMPALLTQVASHTLASVTQDLPTWAVLRIRAASDSLLGLGLALGECVPLSPAARVAHNNHGEQAGGSLWFVRI